jgi:protein-S-isoprenylcysteine O-methyltransferase Ste14
MPESTDRPDILVLPPVLVGGVLLMGLGVHHFLWTVEPLPVTLARPMGLTLFISSGLLAHLAHRAFQRVGTNVLPTKPTLAIATDGPYRHTRNPLYLAALGVYLGVALWVDSAILLLLVPIVAFGLHWGVVLPEERYLERKFGAAYTTYRARVRRWLW